MTSSKNGIIIFSCTLVFTLLFYKQTPGINVFLYECILLAALWYTGQISFKIKAVAGGVAAVLITAAAVVLVNSTFALVMNIISFFLLAGVLMFPQARSLYTSFLLSAYNLPASQGLLYEKASQFTIKGASIGRYIWKIRIFIIPLFVVFIFMVIYNQANPFFHEIILKMQDVFIRTWNFIVNYLDIFWVGVFLMGLFVTTFMVLRSSWNEPIKNEVNKKDALLKTRGNNKHSNYSMIALKHEYIAAVFLFATLNLLILAVNSLDIYWVWFNFKWEGQHLKEFLHEGTYLLILSILISIAVVLYFFRRSLNFYANTQLLKSLTYLWIAQNILLVVSVGIRNFWYIHYFSLAYKRIGVIVFLLLTLYGLYTVFRKVQNRHSSFYLIRKNLLAAFLLLVFCSLFNWDNIIARYNFSHHETAFVHFDYLVTLSDKTLPVLDKPLETLKQIESNQAQKFHFNEDFILVDAYYEYIQTRKTKFIKKWESSGIWSRNLPEYLAYKHLADKNIP